MVQSTYIKNGVGVLVRFWYFPMDQNALSSLLPLFWTVLRVYDN
jgi:hypothetical protein